MQKPELGNLASGEAGLEFGFALLLLFLRNGGALIFENFDEAVEQAHQARAGARLQAGRDECGIVYEAPGAIAHHAGHGQSEQTVGGLGLYDEAQIFSAEGDLLFVAAGIFVVQSLDLAGVAAGGIADDFEFAVLAFGNPARDCESERQVIGGGREQSSEAAGLREWVALGHVEGESVFEDAAGVA